MENTPEEKRSIKEEVKDIKDIKDKIVNDLKEVKDDFKESEKIFEKHPSSLE